jgi:signal transduction histidine kinase
MIKKLKRRFILTSMAVVTLVLLLVSIVLFLGARRVVYSDADQMLKRSLMFSLGEKGNGEGRGGRFERAVVLTVDPETGEVENRSSGTLQNFSEEEQQELAQEAARGGKLKNRGVRASVEKRNGKTYVAVVDTAVEDRLLTAATKALALFAAGTWAALLLLVWLLSGWAVRPMAKAWDMQRQFVADASHDLKTPLTVILSNSELLKQQSEAADTPEMDRIEAAGRRMKDLVQKMLTLARMEDDPNRGAWESMDLSDMVMEGALAFEATAFEKGLTIDENVESGLVVKGNRAQVQSVLECLLDNACKYADPGSSVTVSLEKAGKRAKLTVHNTGSYIPPADLPHVFERFYRADKSRTASDSSGLGLAIVQSVVESMGGTVSVESSESAGTAFTVFLPRENG